MTEATPTETGLPEEKAPVIGTEQIRRAAEILSRYKDGKQSLETRLVDEEEWWRMRQWQTVSKDSDNKDRQYASGWLFQCINGKQADIMDAYPTANFRPHEKRDVDEAKRLSSIVPIILKQNHFKKTYNKVSWYTLKHGGGCFGVFWDGSKHNGIGDVSVEAVDFINLFWEPGITDIQKSRNVFHTELVDNDVLVQRYPQLADKLGGGMLSVTQYLHDDHVDTSDKSVVVDWYYHTEAEGRKALHYCKFVNDTVLYASQNDTEVPRDAFGNILGEPTSVRGWYDHGKYPFVVLPLFPVEGSICGSGYLAIGKDTQEQIDLLNQAIVKNALMASKPRWFIKNSGDVNESEYADWDKDFVHCGTSLGEESIRQIRVDALPGIYVNVWQDKVQELKEITSNRDMNNGGTSNGITAASAIASLQESAGKTSRLTNTMFYDAYEEVVHLVIELIRQFYTVPRWFAIEGENLREEFISYDNSGLRPQKQGDAFGVDMGFRVPEFDVEVSAEKDSSYSKMANNELALQFYKMHFFHPSNVDPALACLNMMDFAHKDEIVRMISTNGGIYQQLLQCQKQLLMLAEIVDKDHGSHAAEAVAQGIGQSMGESVGTGASSEPVQLNEKTRNPIAEKAKAATQEATQPR